MNRWDTQTNALSVYNAISVARRDLDAAEVLAALRQLWDPETDENDIEDGAKYLLERGLLVKRGAKLAPFKRRLDRRSARVQRSADRSCLLKAEFF